jgi:hypothetical protein
MSLRKSYPEAEKESCRKESAEVDELVERYYARLDAAEPQICDVSGS